MSIRAKVLGSLFAILLLFGVVSSYTHFKSRRINQRLSMVGELFLPLSHQMVQIQVGTQNLAEEIHRSYSDSETSTETRSFSRMARELYPYAIQKKFISAEHLLQKFSSSGGESVSSLTQMLLEMRAKFDVLSSAKDKAQLNKELAQFKISLQQLSKRIDDECEKITQEAQAEGKENLLVSEALALSLVFLGLFCMVITYQVLNPLPQLIQSLKKLTSGDFDQNIKVKTSDKDEIGQLAREFNRMLSALKERDQKIKTQQRDLLQSEKLAAIGQLSAEVVHEIRNPLNSISLNIDWLQMEVKEENPEIKKTLASLSREIERLAQITESYLVRARVKTPEQDTTEVNELLRELIHFERGDLIGVDIETDLCDKEIYIQSERSKIKQAFINVLKNAKEAMPNGGKIRVKTAVQDKMTKIIFSDSGVGMNEETKGRSFLPFFTTKSNGTGLGLSLTKEIIESAQGKILVASQVGVGTTFTFQFPT